MIGKLTVAALLVFYAPVLAAESSAQVLPSPFLTEDAQRVAHGLEAQHQAALIRERRLADDRELALIEVAADRMAKLRAQYDKKIAGSEAALKLARTDYANLVRQVASRDQTSHAELEAYKAEVRGLAANASPERLDALQRFADGDRVKSWAVLEAIRVSEDRAAQVASNTRRAIRWREDANLREIMRLNGEATVVQVWELRDRASELDPSDFSNEIDRGRLLAMLGRLKEAWAAAQRGLNLARDDDERLIALIDMGDAHWEGGYWDDARRTYAVAGDIARTGSSTNGRVGYIALTRLTSRLFDDDQNTVALLREYLKRVESEGIAPEKARELAQALPQIIMPSQESISFAEQILAGRIKLWGDASKQPQAQAGADWAVVNEELSIALGEMAFVKFMQHQWNDSADLHKQELAIDRLRLERDASVRNREHLASSLQSYSDAQLLKGDYGAAGSGYREVVAITLGLFQSDPNNGKFAASYANSLFRAGALLLIVRDFKRARESWEMAKALIELLASRSPEARSADSQLMAVQLLLGLLQEASGGG